jgi:hypothetical protein
MGRAYYSDAHGYVCDCRVKDDAYEDLCFICKDRVDTKRLEEEEDTDDDS